MKARVVDGFLVVPYSGHDLSRVALAVTTLREPIESEWTFAFLDYVGGERVAKIPFSGSLSPANLVWLRVNQHVSQVR